MTFSYTDEQLNNLNRDYAVSSVNLEFAKRNEPRKSYYD